MKTTLYTLISGLLLIQLQVSSQDLNEAVEPGLTGAGVIDLLEDGTLNAWTKPSDQWYIDKGVIIGNTMGEELKIPEWIYTKQEFGDFEFSCEIKLTGDNRRNSGVYYRVKPFHFEDTPRNRSFLAPSGYEYDAYVHSPPNKNYWASLGDWYARPSLRIFADQSKISQLYEPEDWNRLCIRARGNRLEYWLNGIKVMDYTDEDPRGSRKGIIGFQIHDGSVMKVEYRKVYVRPID